MEILEIAKLFAKKKFPEPSWSLDSADYIESDIKRDNMVNLFMQVYSFMESFWIIPEEYMPKKGVLIEVAYFVREGILERAYARYFGYRHMAYEPEYYDEIDQPEFLDIDHENGINYLREGFYTESENEEGDIILKPVNPKAWRHLFKLPEIK